MKKTDKNIVSATDSDDMLPEYNFDFSNAKPNRFAPVLKEDLVAALKKARGNKKIAAKLLGINRTTIFRIIDKYGLKDEYIKEYNKQ